MEALLQPAFLTQLQRQLGRLWQGLEFEGGAAGSAAMQQYLQLGRVPPAAEQPAGASPTP